ncbi:GNAT family N-acetyltransferase [Streptomyces sp. NPDC048424]|uniref:GNAT family N-acetyltransferase n=1 Tax=Streptomyces sp. NPDC048424 TaxID=3155265 RepID=UPI0034387726
MTTTGLTYERIERIGRSEEAVRGLDALVRVYQEVYAEPPYREGPRDAADFRVRAGRQAVRDGFRLVLARDGDELVGFSYGYRLPADTGWWRALEEPLDDAFVEENGRRTFNVAELAVRGAWRRQGVAAAMHRLLIADQGAERITLTVRPDPEAAPARTAYATWGYRKVGRARYGDGHPAYDVLVLPVPGGPPTGP